MPTYLYQCQLHGELEIFHSISQKIENCPKCQEENSVNPQKLTRLISKGSTFILTGSGWAKEGYS